MKLAFITGGSSGIGLGIARACREAGLRVVFTYRTEAHREEALALLGPEAEAIRLEITDRAAVSQVASHIQQRHGPVHLLVNNAGLGLKTPASTASFEDWDRVLSVNLGGVINTLRAFLPLLSEGAHVVTTASMSGLFPGATSGVYTTSKFAVVGLMEALRAELTPRGIGVSVVCPGMVKSRIGDPRRTGAEPGENGMDPLECGRLVLEGVRRNDLYILTHPEFKEGFAQRCQAVLRAFPETGEPRPWWPLEESVRTSPIYSQSGGT